MIESSALSIRGGIMHRLKQHGRTVSIGLLVAVSLISATRPRPYNVHEKAYFMDAQTVEFVRPGLNITISSASIAANGTITVNYTLTDPSGLPLDSAGVYTPG